MATGMDFKQLVDMNGKTKLISHADLVRRELEYLFNIEKYSLFFGNNIGVDLSKYLYLTNKTATFNLIKMDIEAALRKYGKVVPVSIIMKFDDEDSKIKVDLIVALSSSKKTLINLPITISD